MQTEQPRCSYDRLMIERNTPKLKYISVKSRFQDYIKFLLDLSSHYYSFVIPLVVIMEYCSCKGYVSSSPILEDRPLGWMLPSKTYKFKTSEQDPCFLNLHWYGFETTNTSAVAVFFLSVKHKGSNSYILCCSNKLEN